MKNENLNQAEQWNFNKLIKVWYVSSIILAIFESIIFILLWISIISKFDSFELETFFFLLSFFIFWIFSIIIPILWFYKKNKLLCIFANLIAWLSFFEWFFDWDIIYMWLIFWILFLVWTFWVFKYNKEFWKVKLWAFGTISILCFIISLIGFVMLWLLMYWF